MSFLPPSVLRNPAVLSTLVLTRRLFADLYTRSAADIIRDRSALSAVKALEASHSCTAFDPIGALSGARSCNSHFGYPAVSKVHPLAFAWSPSADFSEPLKASKNIPAERMPNGRLFATPMLTLVDYVDENLCGHPGVVHGGMSSTIAHSSMSLVAALNAPGAGITPVSLNVDFRRPVRAGTFVKVHAWLYAGDQTRGCSVKAAVHLYSLNDKLLFEAISDIAINK
ncbi:hypothetical protein LPJ53_002940 [Coemansia erecta]|uniref:Thioesterase domain-containing protein n=1 Tax=Coemansia erecta TaxID=147472 RepID=A0A9W8CTB6_9FUNG|nr:hypothetical protein LPJ53_002940 [Coemansia erecta]